VQFPESLLKELQESFSLDTASFLAAHDQSVPVSVRRNPLKPACAFEPDQKVPWAGEAYYLKERPIFTNDPLFHAGCYYVQEASSMFVEQALRQTIDLSQNIAALDACAAPGGKSTLLASLLGAQSLLVSNEVISTRVPVLVHNMAKWGPINTIVSNNDPKDFSRLPGFFDVMVVDAPCSGSGLFRKQEDAIEHWSEENVKHCSLRQQRILHDLVPALKENGILIYSTCSYSKEENEDVCDKIMQEFSLEPVHLKVPAGWGIVETKSRNGAHGYRFFPHLTKGEGFFLACFRKPSAGPGGESQVKTLKRVDPSVKLTSEEAKAVKEYFSLEGIELTKQGEEIIGYPASQAEAIKALGTLKIKKMPLHAGQLKGKDFIPHPYSAYVNGLNENVVRAELDTENALKFLRKQDIKLADAPKGFVLVTYKNFGLGWAKNLGNRLNNYYPAEWRILKEVF